MLVTMSLYLRYNVFNDVTSRNFND